jgi:GMP synthase (glutamine-hydrolysing)
MVNWAKGYYAEVGYLPLTLLKPDPLFDGFGNQATFFESHYWEIKELPDDFELLASSQAVINQVTKLRQSLVYGTQFHPEVNDAEHPDGFRLMQNFFQNACVK